MQTKEEEVKISKASTEEARVVGSSPIPTVMQLLDKSLPCSTFYLVYQLQIRAPTLSKLSGLWEE